MAKGRRWILDLPLPPGFNFEATVESHGRHFVRSRYFASDDKATDVRAVARYEKWGRWKYLAYWSELWESKRVAGLGQRYEGQIVYADRRRFGILTAARTVWDNGRNRSRISLSERGS